MRRAKMPMEEILFAAKFGFLSRSVWEKYFSKRSNSRNCEIWQEFVERKVFVKHSSDRLTDVLVLGPKAITELEKRGIERAHVPGISQINHDEALSQIAVHLMKNRMIESFQTEAEAKKKYFGWMKLTRIGQEAKMPDLLVKLKSEGRDVSLALEVEMSRKTFLRYCQAFKSYSRNKAAQAIIFITDDEYIRRKIRLAMNEVIFQTDIKPVGFSRLKDWLHDPKTAKIDMLTSETTFDELTKKISCLQNHSSNIHRNSFDE